VEDGLNPPLLVLFNARPSWSVGFRFLAIDTRNEVLGILYRLVNLRSESTGSPGLSVQPGVKPVIFARKDWHYYIRIPVTLDWGLPRITMSFSRQKSSHPLKKLCT